MSVLRLDDVIAEVMERTADNGVRIIGVDGPQGSGKSTLATRIAALIGAPLVQMDDFVSCIWVEAPDEVRLRRGLERDGDTHRDLWLDSMITERAFFTDDATRTRADLRVNGNPNILHDHECEVVLLD